MCFLSSVCYHDKSDIFHRYCSTTKNREGRVLPLPQIEMNPILLDDANYFVSLLKYVYHYVVQIHFESPAEFMKDVRKIVNQKTRMCLRQNLLRGLENADHQVSFSQCQQHNRQGNW